MARVMQAWLGLAAMIAVCWLASEQRRAVNWKFVAAGMLLQFVLAYLMLNAAPCRVFFRWLCGIATALSDATQAGTAFVFGYLGGGALPFTPTPQSSTWIMAFNALPMIIVLGALSSLLFHWKILPIIVNGLSWCLRKSMGIGGALSVGVASSVFLGNVEAPLLIRPYLAGLTRGELFALMVAGLATLAGTMLVLYATILESVLPDALGHILTASLISCPAALVVAELLVPVRGAATAGLPAPAAHGSNAVEAIYAGVMEGMNIYARVLVMLLACVALVHLSNQLLGLLPAVGGAPLTFERLTGWLFMPLAWLLGIPWSECAVAGNLLGEKVILNEMIAYLHMAALPAGTLSPQSTLILAYALCGFANLGSVGISLGGIGAMSPERRPELCELAFRALFAGLLATCMTGAVIGLVCGG